MKTALLLCVSVLALNSWADSRGGYKMPPCSIDRTSVASSLKLMSEVYVLVDAEATLKLEADGTGTISQENAEGEAIVRALSWEKKFDGTLITQIFRVEDKNQQFFGPLANTAGSVLKCVSGEMKCMVIEKNAFTVLKVAEDSTLVSRTTQVFEPSYVEGELQVAEKSSTSVEIMVKN